MVIDSNLMEFGNELGMVIPHAWDLHKKGLLTKTISGRGTAPFYYFSPDHVEVDGPRHWANGNIHVKDYHNLECPPYKKVYLNDVYTFHKPMFVISNKYNKEWNKDPVNYLDVDTLLKVIEMLKDYQVIYTRAIPRKLQDDQEQLHFQDYDAIRSTYSDVLFLSDFGDDFNLIQLMVYANCDNFLSVQGGNSILCSCFGGENIIYAVKGQELLTGVYSRLHHLSGCNVHHANSYNKIFDIIKKKVEK